MCNTNKHTLLDCSFQIMNQILTPPPPILKVSNGHVVLTNVLTSQGLKFKPVLTKIDVRAHKHTQAQRTAVHANVIGRNNLKNAL